MQAKNEGRGKGDSHQKEHYLEFKISVVEQTWETVRYD